ncbi:MAG: prephenate dehydrogenase [Planctomycetota bacterium]|nr:prephenate dehydrogenase [Planctomycetota bacterium]
MSFDSDVAVIVGVGLIGGSLARAMKDRRLANHIIGCGRNQARLAAAQQSGLIDDWSTDMVQAGAVADLIVVCTPVDLIPRNVDSCASHARPGTLITDAGSIKRAICESVDPQLATFIGSHPIAGSHRHGHEFANGELFEDRVCIVTPDTDVPVPQIDRLKALWESVGSRVIEMTPREHDDVLAQTSHLPHVVAAALALSIDATNADFVGTGLRDATRIAGGDPSIWLPILQMNQDEILRNLERFRQQIDAFADALAQSDAEKLVELLGEARDRRRGLVRP